MHNQYYNSKGGEQAIRVRKQYQYQYSFITLFNMFYLYLYLQNYFLTLIFNLAFQLSRFVTDRPGNPVLPEGVPHDRVLVSFVEEVAVRLPNTDKIDVNIGKLERTRNMIKVVYFFLFFSYVHHFLESINYSREVASSYIKTREQCFKAIFRMYVLVCAPQAFFLHKKKEGVRKSTAKLPFFLSLPSLAFFLLSLVFFLL